MVHYACSLTPGTATRTTLHRTIVLLQPAAVALQLLFVRFLYLMMLWEQDL